MNYSETLKFIYSQLPMYQRIGKYAYKADLDRTLALDKYFDEPHKNFTCIHIAGTNGKGSVAHSLSSILQEAGYKTGLYTSPHLKDFRERIKINGEMIEKEEVIKFIENNNEIIKKINPSFFEMTVAMAFDYFARKKIDIAVIETGLGGRLDSTNIIKPIVSVITNISLDHTHLLGNDINSIAREKAGIIKEKVPVVIGETIAETEKIFREKARECEAEIFFADQNMQAKNIRNSEYKKLDIFKGNKLIYKDLQTELKGSYQEKNILTVLQAVEVISSKTEIKKQHIYKGIKQTIKNTAFCGRWQIIGKKPLTICDTAHNEAGIKAVIKQISETTHEKLFYVFGVVNDKDIDKILALLPKSDAKTNYIFTQASIDRALSAEVLQRKAQKFGISAEVAVPAEKALQKALKKAEENDLILIGGSTFVVADILSQNKYFLNTP